MTRNLPNLKGWAPDLRQAYRGSLTRTYADSKVDLQLLAYPGDGKTCSAGAGVVKSNPGFTRDQFCKLSAELQQEFDWLDATKEFFDAAKEALSLSSAQQGIDLKAIGDELQQAVKPPADLSLISPVLKFLGSIVAVVGAATETPIAGAIAGLVTSSIDLGLAISNSASGAPLGDQIKATGDLATEVTQHYVSAVNGLNSIREVINSDYGRLRAMATLLSGLDLGQVNSVIQAAMNQGAHHYFATVLMPKVYRIASLSHPSTDSWFPFLLADTKTCINPRTGTESWYYTPDSAQIPMHNRFTTFDSYYWSNTWVLEENRYLSRIQPALGIDR